MINKQQVFVPVSDTKLYAEVMGSGNNIIFIHAGIADCRMWDDQFTAFGEHFRVVRYDVRGFGQSINPEGTYTDHDELLGVMDHFGMDKAILVGASNGGRIAMDFALVYPDKVEALVLSCAGLGGFEDSAAIQQMWENAMTAYKAKDFATTTSIVMQAYIAGPKRNLEDIPRSVREKCEAILTTMWEIPDDHDLGEALPLDPPALERLDKIAAPTLVIQGDCDAEDHLLISPLLAEKIPNAQYRLLPATAHLPNIEQPQAFNDALKAFFQTVRISS